jgi:hypothetical protein
VVGLRTWIFSAWDSPLAAAKPILYEMAISRYGLRRCRYIGLAKTHLQHVITVVAVDLIRIADWHWHSGVPTARTRQSRFAALQVAA